MRGGVSGLFTNSQCPTMVNVNNDNGNGRESRAGLGLALVLMDIGGSGSWWTMVEGAGGGALRAESRITPPKIQGGAAEVNTPASFPTLSHNFGKPRSARRIRAARAGLERPRQAAADSIPPCAKLVRLFALRAAFSVKITHGGIDSTVSALLRGRLPQPRFARQPPQGGGRLRRGSAVSAFSAWKTPPASLRSAAPSGRGPASPGRGGGMRRAPARRAAPAPSRSDRKGPRPTRRRGRRRPSR